MAKIQMRDDAGSVIETVESVHVCTAWRETCETAAICEDCGDCASPDKPVFVWTTSQENGGMTYFACAGCLKDDPYAQLI